MKCETLPFFLYSQAGVLELNHKLSVCRNSQGAWLEFTNAYRSWPLNMAIYTEYTGFLSIEPLKKEVRPKT